MGNASKFIGRSYAFCLAANVIAGKKAPHLPGKARKRPSNNPEQGKRTVVIATIAVAFDYFLWTV